MTTAICPNCGQRVPLLNAGPKMTDTIQVYAWHSVIEPSGTGEPSYFTYRDAEVKWCARSGERVE